MTIISALFLAWITGPLPITDAETLAGSRVTLPQAFAGKPAVLVWSFSRESGAQAKQWVMALEKELSGQVWSVAMLEAAPRLIRGMIRSGMRKDTTPALRPRSLLVYKGEKEWRSRLGIRNDALPIVAVISGSGEIVWSQSGGYSPGLAAEAVAAARR